MFLFGIFIGSLDSGIISPARTVIANSLSISQNNSVWMITIYTLVYAVSIPISGKLSDRYEMKMDYLKQVDSSKALLETTFQNTLNSGFSKLFIAAAVIALIGLILSIMLKNKKVK